MYTPDGAGAILRTMPIEDLQGAAEKIAGFLKTLTSTGGLRVRYRIRGADRAAGDPEGAALMVDFSGPDAPMLTERGGELLHALEHVAAKILRLENDEHDRVYFDANNFKALRNEELRLQAAAAAERVRRTGQPYSFAPMSSRERRLVHLAFREYDDLATSSVGEGARRAVVAHPKGFDASKLPIATSRPPMGGGRRR